MLARNKTSPKPPVESRPSLQATKRGTSKAQSVFRSQLAAAATTLYLFLSWHKELWIAASNFLVPARPTIPIVFSYWRRLLLWPPSTFILPVYGYRVTSNLPRFPPSCHVRNFPIEYLESSSVDTDFSPGSGRCISLLELDLDASATSSSSTHDFFPLPNLSWARPSTLDLVVDLHPFHLHAPYTHFSTSFTSSS